MVNLIRESSFSINFGVLEYRSDGVMDNVDGFFSILHLSSAPEPELSKISDNPKITFLLVIVPIIN